MIVDHIGIAVKSLEEGIKHWENIFGYRQATEVVTNTRQKVRVVFMKKYNSIDIKLIEPIDKTSPVYSFCQKGGGLHHLCFKCEDMKIELNLMKSKGLRILTPPQPGEAFENENIAFVFAKQGLNIELIDTEKRAGIKE
ncbi:MAG TPA: VOC family protein [Bacteroidales bacterium]|nr:VOC family protein [Bacteroidales bacterium]